MALKPNYELDGNMYRVDIVSPKVIKLSITSCRDDAIPIITIYHKKRCPHCKSPKCLNKVYSIGYDDDIWGYVNSRLVRIYRPGRCNTFKDRYFLCDFLPFHFKKEIPHCIYCNSPSVELIKEYLVNITILSPEAIRVFQELDIENIVPNPKANKRTNKILQELNIDPIRIIHINKLKIQRCINCHIVNLFTIADDLDYSDKVRSIKIIDSENELQNTISMLESIPETVRVIN